MILHDMNQSWKQPEGYRFVGVLAQGAFLMVLFIQTATRRCAVPTTRL